MAVIVALILALLPVVVQWLIDLLNKHAAAVTRSGDDAADARTLLTLVLEDDSLLCHPFKRAVVAFLLAKAPGAVAAKSKLSPADEETLTVLAGEVRDA